MCCDKAALPPSAPSSTASNPCLSVVLMWNVILRLHFTPHYTHQNRMIEANVFQICREVKSQTTLTIPILHSMALYNLFTSLGLEVNDLIKFSLALKYISITQISNPYFIDFLKQFAAFCLNASTLPWTFLLLLLLLLLPLLLRKKRIWIRLKCI